MAGTIACWLNGNPVCDIEVGFAVDNENGVGTQVVYDEEAPGGIEQNLMRICAVKSVSDCLL